MIHPRKSPPVGELPDALREWADGLFQMAKLAAKTGIPTHPQLRNGIDLSDWRSHLSMRERRLIETVMRVGVWEPGE